MKTYNIFGAKEVYRNDTFKIMERVSEYGHDFCLFRLTEKSQYAEKKFSTLESAKKYADNSF